MVHIEAGTSAAAFVNGEAGPGSAFHVDGGEGSSSNGGASDRQPVTSLGKAGADSNAMPAVTASSQRTQGMAKEHTRAFIEVGDLVIVFLSRDRPPLPITVTPGLALANTYGTFSHSDMVGMPFGAKLASRNKRGFIHLLRPSPELWTIALPHRTQILYSPDMSFIAAHLGLSPGARVIEAGTGSGSFSHYAARCVARRHPSSSGRGWKGPIEEMAKPSSDVKKSGAQRRREMKKKQAASQRDPASDEQSSGSSSSSSSDDESDGDGGNAGTIALEGSEKETEQHAPMNERDARARQELSSPPDTSVGEREGRVWSFEFHAGRAAKAWLEFEDHGLFPTLSLRHRNVVKAGFGLVDAADAVFLDLPAPWQALHHAARALRRDAATRICCFSPCVEQVLKTVSAMRRGIPEVQDDAGLQQNDRADGDIERINWTDIETYECLQRTHVSVWTGPGSLVPTARIDEAILRIRHTEEKKAKRRQMQIERTRREREARGKSEMANGGKQPDDSTSAAGDKRKRAGASDEEEDVANESAVWAKQSGRDVGNGGSLTDDAVLSRVAHSTAEAPQTNDRVLVSRDGKTLHRANVYAQPFPEMRGHTSYLTFATLPPRTVVQAADPLLERERQQEQRKAAQAERTRARQEARKRDEEAHDVPSPSSKERAGNPAKETPR